MTASTTIYDSTFVFVFLFSILILHERISILKLFSVTASFGGLLTVVWSGSHSEEDGIDQTFLGFLLVGFSAILNAIFQVTYKKYGTFSPQGDGFQAQRLSEEADRESMEQGINIWGRGLDTGVQEIETVIETDLKETLGIVEDVGEQVIPIESSFLFLGIVGLSTVLMFWPGLILLNWTGWEPFQAPSWPQMEGIFINIFFDNVASMSLLLGISWTTPLFMGIGDLLDIPVSVLLDILIHHYLLPPLGFLGISGIVLGFFLLVIADSVLAKHRSPPKGANFLVRLITWSWHT